MLLCAMPQRPLGSQCKNSVGMLNKTATLQPVMLSTGQQQGDKDPQPEPASQTDSKRSSGVMFVKKIAMHPPTAFKTLDRQQQAKPTLHQQQQQKQQAPAAKRAAFRSTHDTPSPAAKHRRTHKERAGKGGLYKALDDQVVVSLGLVSRTYTWCC